VCGVARSPVEGKKSHEVVCKERKRNALAQISVGPLALDEDPVLGLVRNLGAAADADDADGEDGGEDGQEGGCERGHGQKGGGGRRLRMRLCEGEERHCRALYFCCVRCVQPDGGGGCSVLCA